MHLPDSTYYMVNHIFSGAGYPRGAQVTYGYKATGGTPNASQLAALLSTAWASNMMPQLSTSLTLTSTRVKQGPDDTGPFAFAGAAVAGQISGNSDSPNVAALVKKNTALGGRKNAGRWFLPGLSETFTDPGGLITGSFLANLQGACTAFLADIEAMGTSTTGFMVLLHEDDATAPTQVVSLSVQEKVATQRRRLRKVGGRRRVTA